MFYTQQSYTIAQLSSSPAPPIPQIRVQIFPQEGNGKERHQGEGWDDGQVVENVP